MAVTGVMLFGFVLGHMAGNLKLYLGAEALNHYAEWLREVGSPLLPHSGFLWIARTSLLIAVFLHIQAATQLTLLNRQARPEKYRLHRYVADSYAARTMRWGGVIVALFVVYHLAHFTWGWESVHQNFIPGDVYHNVVAGFQVWWVSLLYIAAQIAIGFHLYHGLWSMFQTLGWAEQKSSDWRKSFALTFALIISTGNISFPVAVLLGIVG